MFDFPSSPTIGQTINGPGGYPRQWDGTRWIPTALVQQPIGNIGSIGARNYIHNPIFRVWQRNGPFTGNGTYCADRWQQICSNDTMSSALYKLTDTDRRAINDEQAQWALQTIVTGSATTGSYSYIAQKMENLWRFSNKTLIISFWLKTDLPQIVVNVVNNFGSGGSFTAAYWQTPQLVPVTINTWRRYSVMIKVNSVAGMTFGTNLDSNLTLGLATSASSDTTVFSYAGLPVQSGTIYLWGVQVEIAQPGQTQPSQLDVPERGVDFDDCRRFYQTGTFEVAGYDTAGNGPGFVIPFSPVMRAAPTLGTVGSITQTNCTGQLTNSYNNSFIPWAVATATGAVLYAGTFTASADL